MKIILALLFMATTAAAMAADQRPQQLRRQLQKVTSTTSSTSTCAVPVNTCVSDKSGTQATTYPLYAGQSIPVGYATVQTYSSSGGVADQLKITYDLTSSKNWYLSEVQAWAGTGSYPQTKSGSPSIGNFPAKATFTDASKTVSYSLYLSLSSIAAQCCQGQEYPDTTYKVMTHASVWQMSGTGTKNSTQTAWSLGVDATVSGSWAMYSTFTMSCKCPALLVTPKAPPTKPPTNAPSARPTRFPTASPTRKPSASPSAAPTESPTAAPSAAPSTVPSAVPSAAPSAVPSGAPSAAPSAGPSAVPSAAPSAAPSAGPSAVPSAAPSAAPSAVPSAAPSAVPSAAPSAAPSAVPSDAPSAVPSATPSAVPSASPSAAPSATPSAAPSASPSAAPSASPSAAPSAAPSGAPSSTPTAAPSGSPTASPSAAPTESPTKAPTKKPTSAPTNKPTSAPTKEPTNAPVTLAVFPPPSDTTNTTQSLEDVVGPGCDTAYARCTVNVKGTNLSGPKCFLDIQGINRWGWVHQLQGFDVKCDLYAGAAQCDYTKKGKKIGTATIGSKSFSMELDPAYKKQTVHFYHGTDILPRDSKGAYTVAPGAYGGYYDPTKTSWDITPAGPFVAGQYFILHSTVCLV